MEAAWIAAWLVAWHWQTRSVCPHVVAEETPSAIHFVEQAGRTACATPARAMTAIAENEYFMMMMMMMARRSEIERVAGEK